MKKVAINVLLTAVAIVLFILAYKADGRLFGSEPIKNGVEFIKLIGTRQYTTGDIPRILSYLITLKLIYKMMWYYYPNEMSEAFEFLARTKDNA